MSGALLSIAVHYEHDVVLARQRARQVAALLGFDTQDQTRIATAVSEIARNAVSYAGGGKVEFRIEGVTPPQLLLIRVSDHGPGIARLSEILEGTYRSATGMGLGIIGARRLVDQFEIGANSDRGTIVTLKKLLPANARVVGAKEIAAIAQALASHKAGGALEEIQRQNQELLVALDELTRQKEELTTLNRELEDTNRGVVALYAELDEKADHLRRADELTRSGRSIPRSAPNRFDTSNSEGRTTLFPASTLARSRRSFTSSERSSEARRMNEIWRSCSAVNGPSVRSSSIQASA